ncbi:MAG: hypothetical protein ACREJC_04205, partial [Tepidisphaeraceae bacterium]
MRLTTSILSAAFLISGGSIARSADELVVHEWGTFTSLQDESGRAIGGINNDVEPLPNFVHDLLKADPRFSKGVPPLHPDVTMRLETPVIYFHPPPDATTSTSLDVQVEFRAGLLTPFYPKPDD